MLTTANGIFGTLLAIVVASVFSSRVLVGFLPHFFRVPPVQWRLRVNKAITRAESSTNKIPVMDFGWKTSSVRRQMIIASSKPSAYSNEKFGNKIHVGIEDRKDRQHFVDQMAPQNRKYNRTIYGYFHPFCNAGGGGEKVLWKAVETTLQRDTSSVVAIYTGDLDASGEKILASVTKRFDYKLDSSRIVFIFLTKRHLVDPKTWPRLTLIGQAIGSIILTVEALYKLTPDVWCDTMGYPFSYPVVHWCTQIPIVTYTHYPIISSDMLGKLSLSPDFQTSFRLKLKYYYWKVFMLLYQCTGNFVSIATTNSSWTQNHIMKIWKSSAAKVVYPPCSTENLIVEENTEARRRRKNQAVIIAQFRPEKRHKLIISSFATALKESSPKSVANLPNLIFIGSTRGVSDRNYVEELKELCFNDYKIPTNLVEFRTDCDYEVMKKTLHDSTYGINAMWNEHFGIAVVEYAASGLIPLVHASAGPLLDIVVPWDVQSASQMTECSDQYRTGFFFKDPSDPDFAAVDSKNYSTLAGVFMTISELRTEEKIAMSRRSQQCVLNKFSDKVFAQKWGEVLSELPDMKSSF
ncbi:LADA_0E10506g1_1 [Lachancea dasiensis]|uniref:GDP-Man:Man(3)GlcNAc(2)-PP-Dol alpha-1,2-mannosyltransferase n=1 Tax=Lachancea dasiensis TaxID=1072105 RepID=A0A1G4JE55_9SACH|nr:LADA_0E10506g1_1 [Lachancea dasiensis]